jgi:hypothetical protein
MYLPQCNRVFGTLNFVDVLRDAAKNFIFPPALMPKSTLLNNAQVKRWLYTNAHIKVIFYIINEIKKEY